VPSKTIMEAILTKIKRVLLENEVEPENRDTCEAGSGQ